MHNILSGIYILYFESDDSLYYIGKSINIPKRLSDHKSMLYRGCHHNKKLQQLYNTYKVPPTEHILESVKDVAMLDIREVYWINKFDSYKHGLNMTEGGDSVGIGEEHPGALYSKEVYEEILFELAYTNSTLRDIASSLNISYSVIRNISTGATHLYLANDYPEAYTLMRAKVGSRTTGKYSKEQCIEIVKTLANTEHTLQYIADLVGVPVSLVKGISRGLYHKDIRAQYEKDYDLMLSKLGTRFSGPKNGGRYPNVVSPEGIEYEVTNCIKFSKEHGLDNSTFSKLLHNSTTSHKGWRLAITE